MDVAILVYDGVTAAEVLAPYEVFAHVPDVCVSLVGLRPGPQTTQGRPGLLVAEHGIRDCPPADVIVVPGGLGARRLPADDELVAWVASAHRLSQWTAAVSTGALVLAAAGVLDGCDATGHWLVLDELAAAGAVPHRDRLVVHGRVVTATGAASAFDLALLVVERTSGADVAARVRAELRADPDGSRRGRRRHLPRLHRRPAVEHPFAGAYVTEAVGRSRRSRR